MLLDRALIMSLIPHQGTMCLHDAVLEWDTQSLQLRSAGHRSPTHPLRSSDRLHAVHLCEYGAQAMAVHGGLLARADGKVAVPGMLVSLRQVQLMCARIDTLTGELITHAERIHGDDSSWQYSFRVEHHGTRLASGRAAVMARHVTHPLSHASKVIP